MSTRGISNRHRPKGSGTLNALLVTQFLGAFNDNVFKQIVMLMAVIGAHDYQAVMVIVFALPFVLFSGVAGQISERISKRRMIVLCKVAEIAVMILAVLAFMLGTDGTGVPRLVCLAMVLFLMGTQSAFFGPSKYGVLPELVGPDRLARANGSLSMLTFLAIILGTAVAGVLKLEYEATLYIPGLICVGIAVLGTAAALRMARLPAMNPSQAIGLNSFAATWETFCDMRQKRGLLLVLLASNVFWFNGAFMLTAMNNYGRIVLEIDDARTSLLLTTLSLGIAIGSLSMAFLARRPFSTKAIIAGGALLGLFEACMVFTELWQWELFATSVLGFELQITMTHLLLLLLGAAAGIFSIPILTYLQAKPVFGDKGKVFAVVNFTNWTAILISGAAWAVVANAFQVRANHALGIMGILQFLFVLAFAKSFKRLAQEEFSS